ncbi:MAG: nucleotidyltransferase family protein [Phycisphaerales bacterium]|nr:nucleotidyltransferase family protein [Phycisphaerales bacterium]
MSSPRPIGLLLAAGRSKRLGTQTKQLLPWPPGSERTMIEASYDLLAPFCAAMFVVLDHDADAITAALAPRVFSMVHGDADAPMFDSIRRGLRAIAAEHTDSVVLLHPADLPAVQQNTVQRMLDESSTTPHQALVPQCGGRGGHPVLIPPGMCEEILGHDGRDGLRGYWELRSDKLRRIEVNDPATTMDVDTMAVYQALGERCRPRGRNDS